MKRIILAAVGAALAATALAQSKLDAPAAQLKALAQSAAVAKSRGADVRALAPASTATAKQAYIVTFEDEQAAADLCAGTDLDVIDQRADMAIILLSPADVEDLEARSDVRRISLGYDNKAHLNMARPSGNVSPIHAGTGLDKAYTGKGVVVGMMDTGVDVNHLSFLDANGKPRAKRLYVLNGNGFEQYTNETAISNYTRDTKDETHGTHVMGIMAGAYNGKGAQAYINPATGRFVSTSTKVLDFNGVATEADLVPCAGTLGGNNPSIAAAQILKYAQSVGAPAVMNMSLGHNWGPHDGSSDACRYFAEVGKNMIICVSAGNEASEVINYHKDFTATDKQVKTIVSKNAGSMGLIDIWGVDSTPFTATIAAVNKTTGAIEYSYKFDKTATLTGMAYTVPDYVHDAKFDTYFGKTGAVLVTTNVDSNNNRYNIYFQYQLAGSSNYYTALIIDGVAGKSVDLYCGGSDETISSQGLAGYVDGNDTQCINDLACGKNTISVGAYLNRTQYCTLDGNTWTFKGYNEGQLAPFSSYGKNFQGEQLPHITAPGMGIISAYSNYYVAAGNIGAKEVTASVTGTSRSSYWAEMSGTSMSSPFVAGVCALWLQADPTLTVNDIKAIMKDTAKKDNFTSVNPERWGYGKIDALAGLKKILTQGAVSSVTADREILINSTGSNTWDIFAPSATKIDARLFGMNGALASSVTADGENASLDASSLAPGIYVLRVDAAGSTATRKIAVR